MIKKNKWKLIISSILILLPSVLGLIFWDRLPDVFTTHFGADGNADGFGSKAFAVIGIPLIILALHWVCVFFTMKDPKNKNQNNKVFGMVLWITPFISLFSNAVMYLASSGAEINMMSLMLCFLGVMFIGLGNYLPKCKQNSTIGIKLPWTLNNEENWNKTHRFGGKVWVAGGMLLMFSILLPEELISIIMLPFFLIIAGVPMLYSYLLSRKQKKNGEYFAPPMTKTGIISAVLCVILLLALLVPIFTGDIEMEYGNETFTVNADYWGDYEMVYSSIDKIEYRESCDVGLRTNGFGSPRLLMGTFENDEFGTYTRYSYTKCDAAVVMDIDGRILVIGGEDTESTKEIYNQLIQKKR